MTFIRGESGCGKSSLLQLLNGILSTDKGTITYNNKNITEYDSVKLRTELLLCGQTVYLFDASIQENFRMYYQYRGLPCPDKQYIKEYLHICCLDFPLDTLCTSMSGGERHRVFIAVCLSLMPKVLMLDEPTAALDHENANLLAANLKQYAADKEITLIIVCHDQSIVQEYADDIIDINGPLKDTDTT
jgi:putative ABC transport system ATP-binding protein